MAKGEAFRDPMDEMSDPDLDTFVGKITGENMAHGPGKMLKDCPSRESTLGMVRKAIIDKRRQLQALEQLEKVLSGGVEEGSPLDELLWHLIVDPGAGRRFFRS